MIGRLDLVRFALLCFVFVSCESEAPKKSPPTFADLVARTRNHDPAVRQAAVVELGRHPQGLPPLIKLVDDPVVRPGVLTALKAAGPKAVPLVAGKVADPGAPHDVRIELVRLLGESGDRSAAAPLLPYALDKNVDPELRAASIRALGALRYGDSADDLAPILLEDTMRDHAEAALGQMGAAALAPVETVAKNRKNDIETRKSAVRVLAKQGAAAVPTLVSIAREDPLESYDEDEEMLHIDNGLQYQAIEALGTIGQPAVEAMLGLLRESDEMTIADLARELARTKDPRAIEPLFESAVDYEGYSLDAISDALATFGEPVTDQFVERLSSRNLERRVVASLVLGKIGGDRAVAALTQALPAERDEYGTMAIAAALGATGHPRAVELLMEKLRKKDSAVIAGAYKFFMNRRDAEVDRTLVQVLHEFGDSNMATDFLNTKRDPLSSSAREWAEENGYTIEQSLGTPVTGLAPTRRW